MGIRGSLTLVSAEYVEAKRAGKEADDLEGGESFSIEKDFGLFHEAVRDEKGPIRFLIQGDVADEPFDRPDDEEDMCDGTYFAHVSAETVREIDALLKKKYHRGWMIGRIRQLCPVAVQHKQGRDDLYATFDEVTRAYALAASRGMALQVLMC